MFYVHIWNFSHLYSYLLVCGIIHSLLEPLLYLCKYSHDHSETKLE